MTDAEILKHMGLTEGELTDLLQKLNSFTNNLNPAQRAAFVHSLRTAKDAAPELADVTPAHLESFLKRHAAADGPLCFMCMVGHPPRP